MMNRVLFCLFLVLVAVSSVAAQGYPNNPGDTGITDAACPNWAATKTNTAGRTITTPQTISYEEITGQLTINPPSLVISTLA